MIDYPNETDARLRALEENVEALILQMARIEKALDDLEFGASMNGLTWMATAIRRALNHLRP